MDGFQLDGVRENIAVFGAVVGAAQPNVAARLMREMWEGDWDDPETCRAAFVDDDTLPRWPEVGPFVELGGMKQFSQFANFPGTLSEP